MMSAAGNVYLQRFLSYRKRSFLYDKKLRDDAHSRAEKMSAELITLGAQNQSDPS